MIKTQLELATNKIQVAMDEIDRNADIFKKCEVNEYFNFESDSWIKDNKFEYGGI